MNTTALLESAQAAGVHLSLSGGKVKVHADQAPPADLLAELKAHKAELLATLKAGRMPCSDAELKRRCVAACEGLPIKPKALYEAMTVEDRAAQCSGEEGSDVLRAYARSLAERAKPALAPEIAAAYLRLRRELAENPTVKTAVETWDADAEPVLLAIAVRGAGYATLRIPKARYDGFKPLEIVHRWNQEGTP